MSLILPDDSPIFETFVELVDSKRVVFVAGLPAVGKSLYLQQLALLAHERQRTVHLMQWDVARSAFEASPWIERYPEEQGVTHAAIRKAVGLWARQAITQWHASRSPEHLLIIELPLIDNRLIELVQQHDDEAETLLASPQTHALIPVPSTRVRNHLEQRRRDSIRRPAHEREAADAPPQVVTQLWNTVYELGLRLALVEKSQQLSRITGAADMSELSSVPYQPDVYAATFRYLLQHRHHHVLSIDTVYPVTESVYTLTQEPLELTASPEQVHAAYAVVETRYTPDSLKDSISHWWQV